MNKILKSTKDAIRRNKKTIIVGLSLVAVIVLQDRGIRSMEAFLEEKGLRDEYFRPDFEI